MREDKMGCELGKKKMEGLKVSGRMSVKVT